MSAQESLDEPDCARIRNTTVGAQCRSEQLQAPADESVLEPQLPHRDKQLQLLNRLCISPVCVCRCSEGGHFLDGTLKRSDPRNLWETKRQESVEP